MKVRHHLKIKATVHFLLVRSPNGLKVGVVLIEGD